MTQDDDDEETGSFTYTADAKLEDVLAFHRASAAKHGIVFDAEIANEAGVSLAGQSADDSKRLVVAVKQDARNVMVTLNHAQRIDN